MTSDDPAAAKQALRRRVIAACKAMSHEQRAAASNAITRQLLKLPELGAAQCVAVYVSFDWEPETTQIIEHLLAEGRTLAAPVISSAAGGAMAMHTFTHLDQLQPGPFGIRAPIAGPALAHHVDVCIVPCVAVDRLGGRLGRGGGFYDRLLADSPGIFRVVPAYDVQVVDLLPLQSHDQPVQAIVTPSEVIRPSRTVGSSSGDDVDAQ